MFTGPVGPVEVFFYWPEAVFRNFHRPGAIGPLLASSPALYKLITGSSVRVDTIFEVYYPFNSLQDNQPVPDYHILLNQRNPM